MFNGTYRRNGEGDYLCSKEEVAAIFRDAGQISQDNKIITEVSLDSLCKETISHYRQRFVLIHQGHVWNDLSDVEFLKKLGAAKINSEDGKVYPTAAGLLMFGYESEILYEYPQYFLDYQEHFDESTRWSDRFVSSSGEWSGNVFDFFFKAFNKLTEDIKKPFVLDGITRIEDTPVHKAIREVLLNTLANADYYGRRGVVIKKHKDHFSFENPGLFRISMKEAFDGGVSDPRNATILKMFSTIDIGERAGSGIPGIVSVWKREYGFEPEYSQSVDPERTRTILKLKANSLNYEKENILSSDSLNDRIKDSLNLSENESKVFSEIKKNNAVTVGDLIKLIGISEPTVNRCLKSLKEKGILDRDGSKKTGIWKILN